MLVGYAAVVSGKKALTLDLRAASAAHALTPSVWGAWSEAAAVTLERFHAAPPPPVQCAIALPEERNVEARLAWRPTNDRCRRSHANEIDATEWGAYAIATVAAHAVDGWRIVGRTAHASGADIWMQRPSDPPDEMVRLEVSGMAAGKDASAASTLRARFREKIDQLGAGDRSRPGIAIVVGFELGRVLISGVQR